MFELFPGIKKRDTKLTSQADIFSLHLKQASNQSGRYVATPKKMLKYPQKIEALNKIYQTINDPNDLRHVCFLWRKDFESTGCVFLPCRFVLFHGNS